ncbi:MAG: aminopeptidase P family protein [Micavibrio sp.]|nr:MAG: aminopeptidase P family protein [Micavibrio sp.]
MSLIAENPAPELAGQLKTLQDEIRRDLKKDTRSVPERIASLREEFAKQSVSGFIIPRADEYNGEYVPESAERLSWSTGFTGSAGQAVVLEDSAVFLTDGRYTLQAKEEVPGEIFEHRDSHGKTEDGRPHLDVWLSENAKGKAVGFDPWMHSVSEVARLEKAVTEAGGKLVPLKDNPVDLAWQNRPSAPLSPTVPHPQEYAGKPSAEKRRDLAATLQQNGADAAVLTMPEDIAWLLNIRGGDVPCTPLPLSFAVAHADNTVDLFIDRRKISSALENHLGKDVRIHDRDDFTSAVESLGKTGKTVMIDPASTPKKVETLLKNSGAKKIIEALSPCRLPKALKNTTEQKGAVACHIEDGLALTQFLYELSKPETVQNNTEMSASNMLADFRKKGKDYRGPSFETISGAGSNGAVIHYRVTEDSDKPLNAGPVYLVDSGGQYLSGTTDVTRTVAVGSVTDEMKDRFTRVLIGHAKLAMAVFVKGEETGVELDKKARSALQEIGENFAHGTGHGVGSYLSVHEGPQGISPRATVPLQDGMIVSNEPGYYKDGAYGIRIESLVMVEKTGGQDDQGRDLLRFKTLTMAPIDRNLIDEKLLADEPDVLAWLNAYHKEVRETLLPRLEKINPDAAKWLKEVTAPIVPQSTERDNVYKLPPQNGKKAL